MLFKRLKSLPLFFALFFLFSTIGKAANEVQRTSSDTTCLALFSFLPTDDNTVEFFNLSLGAYQDTEWNMGDGTSYTNPSFPFVHQYESPNLYEVCLVIRDSLSCSSELCLPVFSISENICDYADCVLPGDTNKDGQINIFDALSIGLGFNLEGVVRPNASIEAVFQAAVDWLYSLFDGLDSKHADCDGNGIIDANDFLAIDTNYQRVEKNDSLLIDAEKPIVTLSFEADTLIMEGVVGNAVTIPATLSIGSEDQPLEDFYGIALSFDYKKSQVQDIQTQLLPSAPFSTSTSFQADKIYKEEQYGVVLSNTKQIGKNFFGPVAEVGFVIIEDLIEARTINIDVGINDIKVINSEGKELQVSMPSDSVHLTILPIESRSVTTNTNEQLAANISITPNPTSNYLQIALDGSVQNEGGQLIIYNSLGEQVLLEKKVRDNTTLEISNLPRGIYWIELTFAEGRVSKEIVKN